MIALIFSALLPLTLKRHLKRHLKKTLKKTLEKTLKRQFSGNVIFFSHKGGFACNLGFLVTKNVKSTQNTRI